MAQVDAAAKKIHMNRSEFLRGATREFLNELRLKSSVVRDRLDQLAQDHPEWDL